MCVHMYVYIYICVYAYYIVIDMCHTDGLLSKSHST